MSQVAARRVVVEGVVQGVGFRPFVFGLAARHGVAGWVRNTDAGVELTLEGAPEAIDAFLAGLAAQAPPLACIDAVRVEPATPAGYAAFEIRGSRGGEGVQPVPPDVAACDACLREVLDPADRRFGYPFTTCTHCGPRFTIIRAVPYDRPTTTMAGFTMCAACQAEYDDPADRRFHAQPNACPACGPHLTLTDPAGRPLAGDPLAGVRGLLAAGRIVALKGIGGFHLACDAADEAAVQRLRARKGREAKPLALMAQDLAVAERLCYLDEAARGLLRSPARPIVLARRREGAPVAPSVAPGVDTLGVMLPYAPLHHLLFAGPGAVPPALVLTSGNRSEEPIAIDDTDALARLAGIADAFLLHDRPIQVRCDDSVVRVAAGAPLPIRRGRGYAPYPVRLPFPVRPILACGAELKSTVCLTRGPYAFVSPHVGDLESYETYAAYEAMVARMAALFQVRPEAVAHDRHPAYLSSRFARQMDGTLPRVAVQHHHAHVAACMAEHRLLGPVIGVAFDGTGYGADGQVWGGEVLVADYAGFTRAAHVGYVPMPGGDRAVREPFRMALAHLRSAGLDWDPDLPPVAAASADEQRIVSRQIERRVNAPLTSSVGRLFDAVASLLGVRHRARYEAQAAIELAALAEAGAGADGAGRPYAVVLKGEWPIVVDPAPIVRSVAVSFRAGVPVPVVAARFHATLVAAVVEVCRRLLRATGITRVVLSGGVFQNVALLEGVRQGLAASGLEVFSHRLVPPNDGGLALGQAVVAEAQLARGADGS